MYYVPDANSNLISCGKLVEDGYLVSLKDKKFEVVHRDNPSRIVLIAEFKGNKLAEVTYSCDPLAAGWIRQASVCFMNTSKKKKSATADSEATPSAAPSPTPIINGDKHDIRLSELKQLFVRLGKPSYKALYDMLKNGMILNTSVTAKDVERHKDEILNDPARLMAVITDKPKKHSDTY